MPTKLLLMYSTHVPKPEHIKEIEQRLGSGNVLIARSEEDAIRKAPEVEIIWGHRYLRQVLQFAEKLRWVQSTAAGVDRLPLDDLARKHVVLTRATVSSGTIARHAHTLMWMLIRGLHIAHQNQQGRQYIKTIPILPEPKKALIFGTGAIGSALVEILKRDGLSVVGVNQSGSVPEGFDAVYTGNDWRDLLPEVDVVFLAVPATPATTAMVNHEVLTQLPTHAVVINVGRAETLDTNALCALLQQNRLGGAGLDVTPPDLRGDSSIIWETPNLIITPHNSAHSEERSQLLETFFLQQLDRYLGGEKLNSEVLI